ncbi:oligopeptide ABC transporter permease [Bacillus fonticola]|uniref:oligopeptide ABC transporter permease n=1 Tax=Bacillus fonticola TaxID=2728853 RepID=UPI001473798D|nr:oligopeptide ABC transporter permease [Bacillus fonticola]
MAKYITKRAIYMLITLFIIASATFFLMKFLPGTPFANQEKLSPSQIEFLYEKYGLDEPLPVQYLTYMGNLVQGDLGVSFQFDNTSVTELLLDRIGPSFTIGFQSIILGTLLGVMLGIIAAIYQNSWIDYTSTFVAVIGKAVPSFVFAAFLQYYFAAQLGWFPVAFWEGPEYSILPTIALAIFPLATAARFMRTEMIEVLGSDYIQLARAKGVSGWNIAVNHSIRNALIPLITVLGPLAVSIMTGSLVIENIFAIPGIGDQFVRSIQENDYPVIMGTTMFFSFLFIVIIFVVDILYGIIDPRIRVAGGKG